MGCLCPCSTQIEGYIPGIYQVYILHPPRYISPTTWDRNQKNAWIVESAPSNYGQKQSTINPIAIIAINQLNAILGALHCGWAWMYRVCLVSCYSLLLNTAIETMMFLMIFLDFLQYVSCVYQLYNKHTTLENDSFKWENSLFLWPCSIANCNEFPEGR